MWRAPGGAHRRARRPLRMGVAQAGPRRRDLCRSPGSRGSGAARVPSRGRPGGPRRGATPRLRVGDPGLGRGPATPARNGEPRAAHRGDRGGRGRARGARRRRDSPVRDRGPDRGLGGAPAPLPLSRPATSRDDQDPRDAARDQPHRPRRDGVAGIHGGRDPAARPQHARGCPRLPGSVEVVARDVLRAASVAAAAQAAADGGRTGSLLPDRPVPARRADTGGPQLRVHAARRGDVVRRRGGRRRGDRAAVRTDRARDPGRRGRRAVPEADLRRDDRPVRYGQARPAVRDGARRRGRGVRGDGLPGVRVGPGLGRTHQGVRGTGRRRAVPQGARRARPGGEVARRGRPGLDRGRGRRGSDRRSRGTCRPARSRACGARPGPGPAT